MPSLKQLGYLVALAQDLHFRKAAERANITQPTLSHQIKELEARLEVKLLERDAGRVTLTPLGREVVERARDILSGVQDIVDLAASSQHGFRGTIRLGVPPTLGPYLLPHIVPELHSNHPDLKLYVQEGKPEALQLALREGRFDLVLSPLPIAHSDLTVETLFREPLQVAAALDNPLVEKNPLRKADLAGQSVLALEHGHSLHDQVVGLCREFNATLLRDYEGTSLDTLRLMVGMGVGLAFLPALYVRSEIGDRGEIAVLNLDNFALYRQIGLVWRSSSAHSRLFVDVANLIRRKCLSSLPEVTVL